MLYRVNETPACLPACLPASGCLRACFRVSACLRACLLHQGGGGAFKAESPAGPVIQWNSPPQIVAANRRRRLRPRWTPGRWPFGINRAWLPGRLLAARTPRATVLGPVPSRPRKENSPRGPSSPGPPPISATRRPSRPRSRSITRPARALMPFGSAPCMNGQQVGVGHDMTNHEGIDSPYGTSDDGGDHDPQGSRSTGAPCRHRPCLGPTGLVQGLAVSARRSETL